MPECGSDDKRNDTEALRMTVVAAADPAHHIRTWQSRGSNPRGFIACSSRVVLNDTTTTSLWQRLQLDSWLCHKGAACPQISWLTASKVFIQVLCQFTSLIVGSQKVMANKTFPRARASPLLTHLASGVTVLLAVDDKRYA